MPNRSAIAKTKLEPELKHSKQKEKLDQEHRALQLEMERKWQIAWIRVQMCKDAGAIPIKQVKNTTVYHQRSNHKQPKITQ